MMEEQRKVLIVDGDTKATSTLGHILESKGCEVTGARNLVEGLHYARQKAFSLVLVDSRAACMDGLEVLESLAKAQPEAVFAIAVKKKLPALAGESIGTRFVLADGWVKQLLSDGNHHLPAASPKQSLNDHPTGRELNDFEEKADQFRQAFLRFLKAYGRVTRDVDA